MVQQSQQNIAKTVALNKKKGYVAFQNIAGKCSLVMLLRITE